MSELLNMLDRMKRPRLLISAARIGLSDYRREVHLPRHIGGPHTLRNAEALRQLVDLESEMNDRRKNREASYSATRHVGLLIAMMAEARFVRSIERAQVDGADGTCRAEATLRPCPA